MVVNPSNLNTPGPDEEMKKLLEKNLELTEKMYKMTKYIKRYVIWSQILGVLKILIIVTPIILGIMYLPALFKQYGPMLDETLKVYGELLGAKEEIDELGDKIDLDNLPPDLRKQAERYLK